MATYYRKQLQKILNDPPRLNKKARTEPGVNPDCLPDEDRYDKIRAKVAEYDAYLEESESYRRTALAADQKAVKEYEQQLCTWQAWCAVKAILRLPSSNRDDQDHWDLFCAKGRFAHWGSTRECRAECKYENWKRDGFHVPGFGRTLHDDVHVQQVMKLIEMLPDHAAFSQVSHRLPPSYVVENCACPRCERIRGQDRRNHLYIDPNHNEDTCRHCRGAYLRW
jgi:hypothetical protein